MRVRRQVATRCLPTRVRRQVAARCLPTRVLERKDKTGLIFALNRWYRWSGKRREFDRRSYSDYSMPPSPDVFFSKHGMLAPADFPPMRT